MASRPKLFESTKDREPVETFEPASVDNTSLFTKDKLVRSARYTGIDRDILSAILEDGKEYTLPDVENKLIDFKQEGSAN